MIPEISVLILTWNRKQDLVDAIESVLTQEDISCEIVVVDSASTDGTQQLVCEQYPEIRYIRLPYNMGVIGGRNVGIANCSADLIFFLDDDAVFVEKDALQRVVEAFSRQPDMWVLTCKVLDKEGALWRWLIHGDPQEYVDCEMLSTTFIGCASCVRREAFRGVGYFDQFYFREKEELEFSFRVYNADRYILYYPHATVIHRVNQTQRNPSGITEYYHYRNEILTYFRHLPLLDAAIFWAWNLLADGVRALRQGHFGYCMLANLHLLYLIPTTLFTKRQRISSDALALIYLLRSEPVCADQWLQVRHQREGGLTRAILAYLKNR